jgi:hypothetical protein
VGAGWHVRCFGFSLALALAGGDGGAGSSGRARALMLSVCSLLPSGCAFSGEVF